jgi:hypothetical protein
VPFDFEFFQQTLQIAAAFSVEHELWSSLIVRLRADLPLGYRCVCITVGHVWEPFPEVRHVLHDCRRYRTEIAA